MEARGWEGLVAGVGFMGFSVVFAGMGWDRMGAWCLLRGVCLGRAWSGAERWGKTCEARLTREVDRGILGGMLWEPLHGRWISFGRIEHEEAGLDLG